MKKAIIFLLALIVFGLAGCEKATTTTAATNSSSNSETNQTTSILTSTTTEATTTFDFCDCGYYQQRPFEISLSLTEILNELTSRGYYIVDYTADYYAYYPEDLLAIEQRDSEWYEMTVKYERVLTAYYETDYGELEIDIYQMESASMARDLAHAHFDTRTCHSAVILYSGDIMIIMFWYFEDLMNEWNIDPIC